MKTLKWFSRAGGFALAGVLFLVPAARASRMAVPGTINYVEGQVTLNGNPVGTHQSGELTMEAGQTLSTAKGKAEVLLSPGAYLRLGDNSQVQMIDSGLADPRVEVLAGEAMLEVDAKPKLAGLDVMVRGADASVLKEGLYRFDAGEGRIAVIDGKVRVSDLGNTKEFGKGREVALNGAAPLKTVGFNLKTEDELYRWSDVRASYEAEVNAASAQNVYVSGGWGMGYGPGWFWNPYFDTYAWLPYDGFFWSPFGYPFFSPGYAIYVPRYYGGRTFIGPGRGVLPARAAVPAAGFRSGIPSGGFRSFAGSGFHGSAGGGFHGGGRR
jgi:hypothetical protein